MRQTRTGAAFFLFVHHAPLLSLAQLLRDTAARPAVRQAGHSPCAHPWGTLAAAAVTGQTHETQTHPSAVRAGRWAV